MTLLYLSLLFALIAALGRQIIVFARIQQGLSLFSHWHWLRLVLTSISLILALVGYATATSAAGLVLLLVIVLLNAFSYFFEMPFFFPEVKQVQRVPAAEIHIAGDTPVIGVTVGDTAVAYPINEIVMPRHIVHDTIETCPVLISYCALCRSALAFQAQVDGQALYFQVAGVWRRNMIMLDVQTRSIWQQATGACISGQYKGQQLELLSGENTLWQSWQKKHPHSEYAYDFVEARRGLMSREKMLAGLKAVTPHAGTPGFTNLQGLPKRETVFGIAIDGQSAAYPLSELEPGMRFRDKIGDVEVELQYDAESEYLSAFVTATGQPLVVEKHWWLGWKEFHPHTRIWTKESSLPDDLLAAETRSQPT
jgi:hypothetical protein